MFKLSFAPIDPQAGEVHRCARGAGAFVTFEGRVRDSAGGLRVYALEYEAAPELAEAEGAAILAEATAKFGLCQAYCVHRLGRLEVGEVAVWVSVSAPHRDQAFAGCRYIIDQVKSRVAIWKKEHFVDGPSRWVNCEPGAGEVGPVAE